MEKIIALANQKGGVWKNDHYDKSCSIARHTGEESFGVEPIRRLMPLPIGSLHQTI
jgi:hypothetical protein